jgi:hypothetical protein
VARVGGLSITVEFICSLSLEYAALLFTQRDDDDYSHVTVPQSHISTN